MLRRFPNIIAGAIMLLTANSSSGEELVKGGILTCTPNQLDRKPIVYLFNQEHLVRDDQKYWLLDSLGTIGGRYFVYGGLTPSSELIWRIKNYHDYIALLSGEEVAHKDIYSYLVLYSNACGTLDSLRLGGIAGQVHFRETVSRDSEYVINRVPILPFASCDNIQKLFTYGGDLLIPEAPQVGKNDLDVSKVIVGSIDWTIVVETFFRSRQSALSLEKRENAWQQLSWPFGASISACQVIELDTVQIDTGSRLVESQDVPL